MIYRHTVTVAEDWLRHCRHLDIPKLVVLWAGEEEIRPDGTRVMEAIWSRAGVSEVMTERGWLRWGPRGGLSRVPTLMDKLRGHNTPVRL